MSALKKEMNVFMKKIDLVLKNLEGQRELLEQEIKKNNNLCDTKIITESKKLDVILTAYMKEICKDQ